jgi:hypothetical protein
MAYDTLLLLPFLIVASLLIFMPSFPFSPPPLRQYPLKRAHHQTDILMLLVVVLPFAHPMDCEQSRRMWHHPWCGDDAYMLGLGAARIWAMVGA